MGHPLRLAVVGTVHPHSAPFQTLLAHLDGVVVSAVVDDGGEIVDACKDMPVYSNVQELIAHAEFDAAIVTVPNSHGLATVLPLVRAGKHVLADKPVCLNADEMRRIAAAVEEAGVCFAVGYGNRFRPAHERARRLIRTGEIGSVFAVQGHLFTTDILSRGPDHYLFQKERSGGGILHWLGCHVLDLMLDLVESDVVDVSGSCSNLGPAKIDVEDVGAFSMRFANGVVATMTAGYTIPFSSDTPYVGSPKDAALTVWGSRGKISYDPMGDVETTEWYEGRESVPVREAKTYALPPFPGYTGWLGKRLVEDFAAGIAENRPPRAGAQANLRVLQVLDAVYNSAEEGAP